MFSLQDIYRNAWQSLGSKKQNYLAYLWLLRTEKYLDINYREFVLKTLQMECDMEISLCCIPDRYHKMPADELENHFDKKILEPVLRRIA